jgi:DNA polymerase-3 subunit epsilon
VKLFSWWKSAPPPASLNDTQGERLAALPAPTSHGTCSLRQQRWVVVDVETSGLNIHKDLVLSIGAVVIEDGAIDFSQQFEQTLLRAPQHPTPSVLLHGLGPSALAAGREPAEALLDFLEFVGDSPLLAFHAPFDQHMLTRACKDSLNHTLQHTWLDVAELAPLLLPEAGLREVGLDAWLQHCGLQAEERHHASADALVTAQLALMLFSHARRQGLDSPALLSDRLSQWRRRQNTPTF